MCYTAVVIVLAGSEKARWEREYRTILETELYDLAPRKVECVCSSHCPRSTWDGVCGVCVGVGVWVCRCMGVQVYGGVGVWVCGCVGVRVCGCAGVWVCRCMGVQVCGCVGVWVCGCVGVRVCG